MADGGQLLSPPIESGARPELNGDDAFTIPTKDLLSSLDEYEDDVAGWLNHILDDRMQAPGTSEEDPMDLAALDQAVSHLSTRLQVVTQDTATHLEQTIDDISRTVPRLTYDLQFMRESGLSLQVGLKAIENKTRLSALDDPTSVALERLHYLSTIKSRMENARDVLREAESWSVLESDVSGLIATESYAKAGERLAEANKSMVVFQNTPEFENRRALMISLQNQLEAAVSSALVAAITSRDVSLCRSFFSIFGNIQRETEFRNYYNGSRRADLVSAWQAASMSDCDEPSHSSSSSPLPFSEFFRRFLADFLSRITEEQTNIPAIFPDAQHSLSIFIQSTFDALTPSLSQRLSGVSDHYGAAALPELIKAFRAAEDFAVSTEQIMGRISYSVLFSQPTSALEEGPGHTRRASKRMSMSRRMGSSKSISVPSANVLSGGGVTWELALFESFIDIQTEYASLETQFVDRELAKITKSVSTARSESSNVSRTLQERSAAIFGLVEESLSRCLALTHGYGAVGLVDAINHAFKAFLEASQRDVIPQQSGPGNVDQEKAGSSQGAENALEDLDYKPEDWNDFQLALHLLETCRVIKERLKTFEGKVKAAFTQISTTLRMGRNDPHGQFISGTTKGEAELLLQSSLNSAELHRLLDALDPSTGSTASTSNVPVELSSTSGAMFAPSVAIISTFTRSCQLFLQSVILKPLHAHLSTYASSSVWYSTESKAERGAFDLQIPSFSLSPTSTIQRVAEGLLNLPRLFEVYGDDDALAFSIETLPFVDEESLRALADLSPPTSVEEPPPLSRRASTSPPTTLRRLSSASAASIPKSIQSTQSPLPTLSPEMVSSTWLNSLALTLLSHITSKILPSISKLSASGAAQLGSDLAYLSNIIRALNVEFEDLERWKEVVELKDEDGKVKWEGRRSELRLGGPRLEDQNVWDVVARLRGWDISTS